MNATQEKLSTEESRGIGKEFEIYTQRFSDSEEATREATWNVLVPEFLQKFIPENSVILDIGAGDGLFTKRINAKRKIALDLSSHVQELKKFGIEVLQIPADSMQPHLDCKVDAIFMSNFLEHLPDKKILIKVLEECSNVLSPNGIVMILQPNIRYAGAKYWDYIDHHIALTEYSLAEALDITGFKIEKMIPRFLPYTAKSAIGRLLAKLGYTETFVRFYLRTPLLWKIFGAQTFVVASLKNKK